jgi:hypothetical protein
MSIVKRLASRSLTGRTLGLHVHQHAGIKFHICWGIAAVSRTRYTNALERHVPILSDFIEIYQHLRESDLDGLCECVFEPLPGPETERQIQCARTVRYFRRRVSGERYECRCPVNTSAIMAKKVIAWEQSGMVYWASVNEPTNPRRVYKACCRP